MHQSLAPHTLTIVDDAVFFRHVAPGPHPERPARLEAARSAVAEANLPAQKKRLPIRPATTDELLRVHDEHHLQRLGQTAGQQGFLDPDTFYSADSWEAALLAAGGAVCLVDALLNGQADAGAALLRPPGHHAGRDNAMGFCLLNNVAVAAAHARSKGIERVAIVDFDVHHGNGTQDIFYRDPNVLFVSLHQHPFYPGTGDANQIGAAEGTGYTINLPLAAGAGDAVYAAAFRRIVVPVLEQFSPELVLISAGFDAHTRDPLAGMSMTDAGYGLIVRSLSSALRPEVPRALLLEGGYDLAGLRGGLKAALEALWPAEGPAPTADAAGGLDAVHERDLARVRGALGPHFKLD